MSSSVRASTCCTGPNDLGKSTLAAIRLGLLLPHTSTHIEEYVPWTGGRRSGRRNHFRNGNAANLAHQEGIPQERLVALLQESKNGVDFDDVERGEKWTGGSGTSCAGAFRSQAARAAAKAFRQASSRPHYSPLNRT